VAVWGVDWVVGAAVCATGCEAGAVGCGTGAAGCAAGAVGCGVGAEGSAGCVAAGEAVLFWDVLVWAQRGAATARQSKKREVRSPGMGLTRLRTFTSNILPNCQAIRANGCEERLQFDREGGADVERLVGLGMSKREMGGVEEVSVELEVGVEAGYDVRSAVEGVADNGVAEGLGVNANLVGAAGFDADFDEGEGTIRSGETFENMEV